MSENFPTKADAVILGGGVMGASTAYHLCKAGMRRVLLLEREPFFGTGATGRCAGVFRYQFNTEINIRPLPGQSANARIPRGGNWRFVLNPEMRLPVCADP